jgi:hypothetical protein
LLRDLAVFSQLESELGHKELKSLLVIANNHHPMMSPDLRSRSTEEVFEDHLRLAKEHNFEDDVERNVSPDIVVLERRGIFRGRDGVRELALLLMEELPNAPYVYTNQLVSGRMAFLEWTSEAEFTRVRDGADSFLIENGWVVAQTIHYTVESK